jgi:hypothetical protein
MSADLTAWKNPTSSLILRVEVIADRLYESKISDLRGGDGNLMVNYAPHFCFSSPSEGAYFYSTINIS